MVCNIMNYEHCVKSMVFLRQGMLYVIGLYCHIVVGNRWHGVIDKIDWCRKAVELRERLRRHLQREGGDDGDHVSRMEALQTAVMETPLPRMKASESPQSKRTTASGSRGRGLKVKAKGVRRWSVLTWMMMVFGVGVVGILGMHIVCTSPYCSGWLKGGRGMCEIVERRYRLVVENELVVRAKGYVPMSLMKMWSQAVVHVRETTIPLVKSILIKGVDDVQTFLMMMEQKGKASQSKGIKPLNPAVLNTLVGHVRHDTDGVWASTLSFLEDVWKRKKVASSNKANVVMFACTSPDACQSIEDELVATTDPLSVLKLHTTHSLETEKGEVQSRLARFLKEHPTGVVVIPRVERWSPVLISVLNNALGEGGSLMENGESISASEATYFFTVEVPKSLLDESQDSAPHLTSTVKKYLMKKLIGDDIASADEMALAVSNSFRRRIDVVAASIVLH